jgi:late competence protein required for DNA uptake (superfamily II DNA/RNA helicase)
VLQSLGLAAEHIDGDDPKRKEKLEDFRTGKITHLCNAMLLTEGYDEPSIQCIVPLRPTASQPYTLRWLVVELGFFRLKIHYSFSISFGSTKSTR